MKPTLTSLREKIIAVVPEIRKEWTVPFGIVGVKKSEERPISLADVLRATKHKANLFIRNDGVFFEWEKFTEGGSGFHGVKSTWKQWDFSKSLDEQEPELHEFLNTLLP